MKSKSNKDTLLTDSRKYSVQYYCEAGMLIYAEELLCSGEYRCLHYQHEALS